MAIIIPVDATILDRVLETAHAISPEGLSRHAYAPFDAAQMRTAWGRPHRRPFALVEGGAVLASAMQYDLAAVLDLQPVRVCGIAEILPPPALAAGGPVRELVDRRSHERRAVERRWRSSFRWGPGQPASGLRRRTDDRR